MAKAHSTRPPRRIGRSGGNRPRTHPSPKFRRKPATRKGSKPRTAAYVLRDLVRQGGAGKAPQVPRVTEAKEQPVDGVPAIELRRIRSHLEIASAVAYICAAALKAQTADNNIDVARALRFCCGDVLFRQMQQIGRLLGEDGDSDNDDVGGAL